MSDNGTNKTLLIIIALLLAGVLGILVLQATKKTPEEKMADSVSKTMDDIGSAITGKKKD